MDAAHLVCVDCGERADRHYARHPFRVRALAIGYRAPQAEETAVAGQASDGDVIARAAVERSEILEACLRAVIDHVVDLRGYMTSRQQEILREARAALGDRP